MRRRTPRPRPTLTPLPPPHSPGSVCYYDASRTGSYRIHIHLEDSRPEPATGPGVRAPIAGSPYRVRVLPAPPDPYATRAEGPGVTEAVAGRPALRDRRAREAEARAKGVKFIFPLPEIEIL